MIRPFILALCLLGSSLAAQHSVTNERITRGFDAWVLEAGVQNAVLIAQKDGETVLRHAKGWTHDKSVDLASLSKSVTALCVAVLIRKGTMRADMTSAEVLGYGRDGLTVGQLLTHSAGLSPDQTQGISQRWLDWPVERATKAVRTSVTRAAGSLQPGKFQYNNENYAVLGEMITAVTGQNYAEACSQHVTKPAGASRAVASPHTGATLAWGGWHMPLTDYAAILEWGYGAEGIVGATPQDWPQVTVGGAASYGMGMFQRPFGKGHNYWHFGSWCFPLRHTVGAYAVRWVNGWSVLAAYDVCLDNAQMAALDRAMVQAVFQ